MGWAAPEHARQLQIVLSGVERSEDLLQRPRETVEREVEGEVGAFGRDAELVSIGVDGRGARRQEPIETRDHECERLDLAECVEEEGLESRPDEDPFDEVVAALEFVLRQ